MNKQYYLGIVPEFLDYPLLYWKYQLGVDALRWHCRQTCCHIQVSHQVINTKKYLMMSSQFNRKEDRKYFQCRIIASLKLRCNILYFHSYIVYDFLPHFLKVQRSAESKAKPAIWYTIFYYVFLFIQHTGCDPADQPKHHTA